MPKDLYKFLAKRVRDQRKQAGLSIEKLAEAAGIGAGFLAHIETNAKKPSIQTIGRIADALDVPVSDLFQDAPRAKRNSDYKTLQQLAQIIRGATPSQKSAIVDTVRTLAKSLKH